MTGHICNWLSCHQNLQCNALKVHGGISPMSMNKTVDGGFQQMQYYRSTTDSSGTLWSWIHSAGTGRSEGFFFCFVQFIWGRLGGRYWSHLLKFTVDHRSQAEMRSKREASFCEEVISLPTHTPAHMHVVIICVFSQTWRRKRSLQNHLFPRHRYSIYITWRSCLSEHTLYTKYKQAPARSIWKLPF